MSGKYDRGWYDLPAQERKAVALLAEEGKRHPDPSVATVAEQWSADVLARRPRSRAGRFVEALFDGVLSVIDLGGGGGAGSDMTLSERRERSLAKSIRDAE